MDIEQIEEHLKTAGALRMPRLDPNSNPGLRIAALEEYLLQTAYHRGDLEEAMGWVMEAKHRARDTLDHLMGWEMHVRGERTAENVLAAKRKISPDAVKVFRDADYYMRRLERQIRRLERDHDATSRAYTFITGSN